MTQSSSRTDSWLSVAGDIRPSRSTTLYQFIQEQVEAMNRTTVVEHDAKNG